MKNSESLLDLFSPINYMERITSKISLIHGKGDCIIPESGSILLAEKLKSLGKSNNLQIAKLLGHGDSLPLRKQVSELPGVASAFGYFFSNI